MTNPKSYFNGVVGQTNAIQQICNAAFSLTKGNPVNSVCFLAGFGGGKTEIMIRAASMFADILDVQAFNIQPSELRHKPKDGSGCTFNDFINVLTSGDPFVVSIDELQDVWAAGATVQLKTIGQLLRLALDETKHYKPTALTDSITICFDPTKHIILAATNKPEKCDAATLSRFTKIDLVAYDKDDIKKIIKIVAGKLELNINDTALNVLANTGRGSARQPSLLMKEIKNLPAALEGLEIDSEHVIEALRMVRLYPKGLDVNDVRILRLLEAKKGMIIPRAVILASMVDYKSARLSIATAYMASPELEFIELHAGGYKITNKGLAYLGTWRKKGFDL